MARTDAEVFLPQPTSEYDGWPFMTGGSVTCPHCEADSPTYEYLSDLVAWADRHLKACPGPDDEDE